ncbi:MAG: histidinol-phosphate transaminase [Natronomonas sp.]
MEPRDLSAHVAYEAGRGVEEVARELGIDPDDLIKLSSNENPFGPAPKAVDAIREHAESVHYYPKTSAVDLRERLAEEWSLDPQQVWLANGGDGALDYLARAMLDPGDGVLVSKPGFAYYAMSARYHHGTVRSYPLERDDGFGQSSEQILNAYDGERIVYITSPHNPTGTEATHDTIVTVAEETAEETLVLVDEAYGEFTDTPSAVSLFDERDDIAVLRTFSKAYGLAGLRLGYALVPESWAGAYARVNTPFAASEIACRAGLAALDDEEHLERTIEGAEWAREYMASELDAHTFESTGNFVLAEVGDGAAVAEAAQKDGVIVRDTSSFGLEECIRITCGTKTETERAVEVLNDLL